MIDKNKTYRTEKGCEVRIYATDGMGEYPVHGAYKGDRGWAAMKWPEDGGFVGAPHPRNLVEVKPRIKRTVWFNIYKSFTSVHPSESTANSRGDDSRIACVKMDIDVEEGHGLNETGDTHDR